MFRVIVFVDKFGTKRLWRTIRPGVNGRYSLGQRAMAFLIQAFGSLGGAERIGWLMEVAWLGRSQPNSPGSSAPRLAEAEMKCFSCVGERQSVT
ncbi:hypothetical protein MTBUT4_850001 [Magnetospirillum sp. UT-4]|nr:hypothetical protein MTBUT4_850001 [Magnetospirillum sp. UT-4]